MTSRKKEKEVDDCASMKATPSSTFHMGNEMPNYDKMSNAELDAMTKSILMDNIKQTNVEEVMRKFDRNTKIQICQQQIRLQQVDIERHEKPSVYCNRMRKALESKEEFRDLVTSLRVTLGAQNFTWIDEFGREGGFHLLVSIISKLLVKMERLKVEAEPSIQTEDELVFCLHEILRSTRTCLNCEPGVRFLLRSNSRLCYRLVEAMYITIELKSARSQATNNYDQLIVSILNLLAAISFLGNDDASQFEISGNALLIREMTTVAERRNMSSRFACIVRCLHFKDVQITYKALVFINTLLSCIDDNDWHVRMLWRNELFAAGMKPLLTNIRRIAEKNENIHRAYTSFENEQKADYEELLSRFENLRGDVTNVTDCTNMLISSCKETESEFLLQEIMLRLLLVNDRKYKRETYYKMVVMCISEIAFGNMGNGPDFGKQVNLNLKLDESLEKIENHSNHERLNKLLETAIQAKQEAISLQLQYYKKIQEFQNECTRLRKHISDKVEPLPEVTLFNLPKPSQVPKGDGAKINIETTTSSAGAPPPPAPPPPPPSLLGSKKTVATGGTSSGPPPPPPPPPPSFSKTNALMGPPPPPSLRGAVGTFKPEIPQYLKKKTNKISEVPMKKIPWNAAIIKPDTLNKDSLWAQIDESEIASDDIFDYLKKKFSTASKNPTAGVIESQKKQAKTKVPVVIQDQKMLQALAILQGSCKLSFKEWYKSLMEVDDKALNAGLVNQLRNALPPIEMINKLKQYTHEEIQNMPEGEQFVATLSKINALPIRLEAIHLSLSWVDAFSELKSGITIIAEACEEIIKSEGLKSFINLVLLAGNFMGRSKNSTDTFAFELGILIRLIDTKDTENSETLLHGLVFLMHKKFNGKYNNFALEDFHHVTKACKIDSAELEKSKNYLQNSVKKITIHLDTYLKQSDNDHFPEKVKIFLEKARKDMFTIETLWEHMQLKWSSLQTYLCFDPKKYPMERLFNDLNTFKGHYQNVITQITKSLHLPDPDASKKTKRKPFHQIQPTVNANEVAKKAKQISSRNPNADNTENSGGVLDKIEQMLAEGKYRPDGPDGAQRTGYRIRRKGQPTVFKSVDPQTRSVVLPDALRAPSAVELLQRLRGLD